MKFLRFSEIHLPNPFRESARHTQQTQAYEKAEEKLRHKSFAEKNYSTKETILRIRDCYPFLSVGLGVIVAVGGAWLLVESFPQWLQILSGVLIAIFSLAIISIFELLKIKSAREVFGEQNSVFIPVLLVFFGISVGISVGGGYLGSRYANDQTKEITQDFSTKTDSIRNLYLTQIEAVDLAISNAQKELNRSGYVGRQARMDFPKLQAQKTDLLEKIKSESNELAEKQTSEIQKADDLNQYKTYIICLIVLVFELFYIFSFWFEYYIERRIKTENRNHTLVPSEKYDSPEIIQHQSSTPQHGQTMDLQGLMTSLQQLQSLQIALNSLQGNTASNIPNIPSKESHPKETQKVGFQFDNRNTPKASNANSVKHDKNSVNTLKTRCCNHCGKKYTYKRSTSKYCSKECRTTAWENRTGKTLKPSKKGGVK